ncbi:MAG TPA: alanine racemase, partial [bacterium]|nr:alanine racemase [bacterium]
MERFRPTVAVIDQAAFVHNLRLVRKRIGDCRQLMAVVKANAYGHGAVALAKAAADSVADWLGVATVEEALELRESGILSPILVFGAILPSQGCEAIQNQVRLVVPSIEIAESINSVARAMGVRAKVHVKVDTGMGRIGFWYEDIGDIFERLCSLEHLEIEGIMTHFPESDSAHKSFTHWQIGRFGEIRSLLESKGVRIPIYHAANSGAVLDHPGSYFDMVRPGIMLYGQHPSEECSREEALRAVMSLKTQIVFLKTVPAGRSISYART